MHDDHPLPGADVVVDGVRLHVVRHGRDAHEGEPPVVLVHGREATSRIWSDVARDLEHEHRCLAPDLAGCGRSERPTSGGYDPPSQARLIGALLAECGADRAVVVGHDVGGLVALQLAALARERVRALVLVAAPVHAEVWRAEPVGGILPSVAGVLGRLARGTADVTDGPRRLARAVDPAAAEAALGLVSADPPPTLVLWGEDDAEVPAGYGARLAAAIPGAVWAPVAGAGHRLPAERPERVAEEISGFLAELPVGT